MERIKGKINQQDLNEQICMLGYFFPSNEEEINNFNIEYASYVYKSTSIVIDPHSLISCDPIHEVTGVCLNNVITISPDKNSFFKRAVLAAEIVSQLHSEPTFGHVKFQKLVFLCEHAANIKLTNNYTKQVAGPYDRKFMHSIDLQLKQQKWFEGIKENKQGIIRFKYVPLEKNEKYKQYYAKYFSSSDDKIQWIINVFRKEKTYQVELIATIFACWLEIMNNKEPFSEENLISKFYNWSVEKEKFSLQQVNSAILWMKANEFVPSSV